MKKEVHVENNIFDFDGILENAHLIGIELFKLPNLEK